MGGSINLTKRFHEYFNSAILLKRKERSYIHSALLKYGYSNFNLDILEYCKPEDVLSREQYYMDLIKPRYNLLKFAGSRTGFKHSDLTLSKMSQSQIARPGKKHSEITKKLIGDARLGLKLSEETRAKISAALTGLKRKQHSEETKNKMKTAALNRSNKLKAQEKSIRGLAVIVTDLNTGEVQEYPSISLSAKALNVNVTTIRRHIVNQKPLQDRYQIVKKLNKQAI